jgi:methyltransferase (TIGR00027 family)
VSEPRSSVTAEGVAALRAAHQLMDRAPRVLEDPIALKLLEPRSRWRVEHLQRLFNGQTLQALRSHVVLRSRFAEDCLAEAVARGVTQAVILGAGFDTFAYRQPDWAHAIRIFEVDQPATQRTKRDRLVAANVTVPGNVTFVPVNFERDVLGERLRDAGFDPDRPAFYSWLGVTMYLEEPAIDAVLKLIAAGPAGTEVVFTFAPSGGSSPEERGTVRTTIMSSLAALAGEPWRTRFSPPQLSEKLSGMGFRTVHFLTPEEARRRYFDGRPDDVPPPRRITIVRAVV